MAAPILQNGLRGCLRCRSLSSPATYHQVRFKGNTRIKVAKEGKVKEKWVKRERKSVYIESKPMRMSESFQKKTPEDNVWIRHYYPLQRYGLEESIDKHRELAQPAMLNNMDGFVYVEFTLDMKTTKKAKFIKSFKDTVLLPNQFHQQTERKVAVLCTEEKDIEIAKEMGALFVGGQDLIKQIENGEVDKEEFEFLLAVPEMVPSILPIRPIIRDKFPMKVKGNINTDVKSMMEFFMKATTYQCAKQSDLIGKIQAPLGTINMITEQLVENYQAYLPNIMKYKPTKTVHFITELCVIAPPSDERFFLSLEDAAPGYKKQSGDQERQSDDLSDDEDEEMADSS